MSNSYSIKWIGWNQNGVHDKIWGWLEINQGNRFLAFWGRRGKTLRFKEHGYISDLGKLQEQKNKKGYTEVPKNEYNKLCNEFSQELEIYCMTAILSDKVM